MPEVRMLVHLLRVGGKPMRGDKAGKKMRRNVLGNVLSSTLGQRPWLLCTLFPQLRAFDTWLARSKPGLGKKGCCLQFLGSRFIPREVMPSEGHLLPKELLRKPGTS